jgi:hypothetical protein
MSFLFCKRKDFYCLGRVDFEKRGAKMGGRRVDFENMGPKWEFREG